MTPRRLRAGGGFSHSLWGSPRRENRLGHYAQDGDIPVGLVGFHTALLDGVSQPVQRAVADVESGGDDRVGVADGPSDLFGDQLPHLLVSQPCRLSSSRGLQTAADVERYRYVQLPPGDNAISRARERFAATKQTADEYSVITYAAWGMGLTAATCSDSRAGLDAAVSVSLVEKGSHQRCPARLVTGAQTSSGVAVEVLVEQMQVSPVWIP